MSEPPHPHGNFIIANDLSTTIIVIRLSSREKIAMAKSPWGPWG